MNATKGEGPPAPSEADLARAAKLWSYTPMRRCWVALPPHGRDGEWQVIIRHTAHLANARARLGWTVVELTKGDPR